METIPCKGCTRVLLCNPLKWPCLVCARAVGDCSFILTGCADFIVENCEERTTIADLNRQNIDNR